MKTIAANAVVGPDRRLVVQLPSDVAVSEHEVVLVIDDAPAAPPERPALRFSAYSVGLTSDSFTFRREDLYSDAV